MGLAGVFMHSSFLFFLASLWLLAPLFHLFRPRPESRLYVRACICSTVGIFGAAIVAFPFVRGNIERVANAYLITSFIGGTTTAQQVQSLAVVYWTLAHNIAFLVKPMNIVAIALGVIVVLMKGRGSFGRIFAVCWFLVIAILSLLSGQTDRFVLFSMIPAVFIVGNLVGNIPIPARINLIPARRRSVTAAVLVVLVAFGGFLPLIPAAFNPASRLHEQDVFASMTWLEQNRCPSGIASLGLDLDFRYLQVLTGLQYSGTLPTSTTPDQALQESKTMAFKCIVMQVDNPGLPSYELSNSFQERYRNSEVTIFFIIS